VLLCVALSDSLCSVSFISVGHDLRKAVVDGWPIENGIASDLHSGPFPPPFLS